MQMKTILRMFNIQLTKKFSNLEFYILIDTNVVGLQVLERKMWGKKQVNLSNFLT